MKENTALTVQNQGFAVLANQNNSMMTEELDGLDLQFERIKIPSGGGIVFEVPGEDGEPDTVKDFSAVIVYHHPLNCYYTTKYSGGSNPPDCGSFDGVIGTDSFGAKHNCKTCKYNQYGSGTEGTSAKACKNRRRIYLLREGEMFPMLLSLPTGSLKLFTKYLQSQLSKGRPSNAIVTKFSLKKATNSGGIAYSQCNFALDRILTPDEQKGIAAVTEQVKSYAGNVGFDAENAADGVTVNPDTGKIVNDGDMPF